MQNKKIVLIAILVAALFSAGFIAYKTSVKENASVEEVKISTFQKSENEPVAEELQEAKENVNVVSQTKEIRGKVVGISPEAFIVEKSEGAQTIKFTMETPVQKIENGQKKSATLIDVSAGTNINATVDSENNIVNLIIE